jgi:hypothetical protein
LTAVADERRVRRIVVVFSGGSANTSVTGLLASLVSEGGADITGGFLEDRTLFRLAELPFTTEVCRITTARRPLTRHGLERQMKVQALSAKQAIRRVAERVGSPWSFRTHRGRLSTALGEARDVDLVLLGTARRVLVSAREVRGGEAERLRPVAVLFDRAETAVRALDAGIDLAERMGRALIVFLSEEAAGALPDLTRRLQSLGPKRSATRMVASAEPAALLSAVRRAAPAVLIVGTGETGFDEPKVSALQRELRCPMIVVRVPP